MDAMLSRLDGVKKAVDKNVEGIDALQDGVLRDKATSEDLLANGRAAQQVPKVQLFGTSTS